MVATPHLILNILHNNYARWPEKETINDRMKLPAKSYKGGESPAGKVAGSRDGWGESMGDKMVLTYIQNYLRFQRTFEAAKSFIEENGGNLDRNNVLVGTPFKLENVDGKFRLVENGEIARDDRLSEVGESLRFQKEFPFFSSEVRFWQKEGKISSSFRVQRLDGDILNHAIQNGDIVLVHTREIKFGQETQLMPGEKVITRLQERVGFVPEDLYILANLTPHIEIPELSRRFGLERADFWTVWKPQEPLNFFYKRYEYDEEKEKDVIVEARIEKGYAVSYPWTLDWAYISVSEETFGYLRTKPLPFESWQSVADDFKIPPKEVLSAKEVTKRLLAGEPFSNFENVGVSITKPRGYGKYGYKWHARGIDVPWEVLSWDKEREIPENCQNLGFTQHYYLITDGKEAFIIKSLKGERFLAMPESNYGALVIGDSEQAKKFREEIRKEENYMLEDDFVGYIVDKIVFDDYWYAIRVLPDGRYQMEEWSDSSSESDKWILESVDQCYQKAYEMYEKKGGYIIGQEVDYWAMPMELLGSIDSDHSLLTFKILFDSQSEQYFIVSDDATEKDEKFILEYFGEADDVLAWLETAEMPEHTAETLAMIVNENN